MLITILIILNLILLLFLINSGLRHEVAKKIFPQKYKIINQNGYKRRLSVIETMPVKPYQSIFVGHSQIKEFPLDAYFEGQILNMGVDGETIIGLNTWLPEKVRKHKPNKLFIQIGINDLLNNEITDNLIIIYEELLDNCLTNIEASNIYLCSVLPINKKNAGIDKKIRQFNKQLLHLAQAKTVNYVPLYHDFEDNKKLKAKYDCGDGLHLNAKAYQKWSDVFGEILRDDECNQ